MRTFIGRTVVGIVCLAALATAGPARADPKKEDDGREQLGGKWQVVAWEHDGDKLPVLFSEVIDLDVKLGTYKLDLAAGLAGWSEHRGTFTIVGVEKGVFQVDLEYKSTGPVGESNRTATSEHKVKAIFELVGRDELRVCRAEGKDRPDRFETRKGDGRTVEVLQRKKP
jgi:uncharacterized protein (TIGR03067 family)